MPFARVVNDTVAEIIQLPEGVSRADAFHPDVAATLHVCGDSVEPGWLYRNGRFVAPAAPEIDLGAIKAEARAAIDNDAENARLKYITGGAGQAMTYQQKVDEARRYLADPEAEGAKYPMLEAEIGITGPDYNAVATTILDAFTQWQQVGAAIERTRLGSKTAVDNATAPENVQKVLAETIWP